MVSAESPAHLRGIAFMLESYRENGYIAQLTVYRRHLKALQPPGGGQAVPALPVPLVCRWFPRRQRNQGISTDAQLATGVGSGPRMGDSEPSSHKATAENSGSGVDRISSRP